MEAAVPDLERPRNTHHPPALVASYRAVPGASVTKRAGRVAFSGRLAQLVRAAGLQPAGRGFESLSAHHWAHLSAHHAPAIVTCLSFWDPGPTRSDTPAVAPFALQITSAMLAREARSVVPN